MTEVLNFLGGVICGVGITWVCIHILATRMMRRERERRERESKTFTQSRGVVGFACAYNAETGRVEMRSLTAEEMAADLETDEDESATKH